MTQVTPKAHKSPVYMVTVSQEAWELLQRLKARAKGPYTLNIKRAVSSLILEHWGRE